MASKRDRALSLEKAELFAEAMRLSWRCRSWKHRYLRQVRSSGGRSVVEPQPQSPEPHPKPRRAKAPDGSPPRPATGKAAVRYIFMTLGRALILPAVACAASGLLVAGCDSQPSVQLPAAVETASASEAPATVELPVAPSPAGETWIVPHDCAPGASPATIEAAFDVFKLRCDPQRAETVRGVAAVAALATRAGAVRSVTARGATAAGSAAVRSGGIGGSIYSGYSTSDVETLTPLSDGRYEVVMKDGNSFVVDQIRISR